MKLLAGLLIVLLLAGVIGCGEGATTPEPTVTLEPTPTVVPTPSPIPASGSRLNPAPLGVPLAATVEDILYDVDVTREFRVTVLRVIRGEIAWDMIRDANLFNDPPATGHEYMLIMARVEYRKGSWEEMTFISIYSFDLVSAEGKVYDEPGVVEPEPKLRADLFPGASVEGWMAWEVLQSDVSPVLAFEMDYRGRSDAWFAMLARPATPTPPR